MIWYVLSSSLLSFYILRLESAYSALQNEQVFLSSDSQFPVLPPFTVGGNCIRFPQQFML